MAAGLLRALVLTALAGFAAVSSPSVEAQTTRVSGEYGLWVWERDGEVHVHWLTDRPARGVLTAIRGDERLHRAETPEGRSHAAVFPRPGDGVVELRYGTLEGEGTEGQGDHQTEVHLTREPTPGRSVLTGVDSLFAVGDVHGEFEILLRLLSNADLVDAAGHWTGGRKHVAFLGDVLDRGADVTRTLWFLYRLEREAAAAGGGAHVVLGNHETMVFTDDVRYVASKERLLATLHGTTYPRLLDIRESVLGRWLSSRPGLMKVDGALLAHGGVAPGYAAWGVEEFNDSLRAFMAEDLFYRLGPIFDASDTTVALVTDSALVERVRAEHVVVMDSAVAQRRLDFFFADTSVFWFRDYVATDTLGEALAGVLERHDARVHVVGHTPVQNVESRYEGALIAADMREAATEMVLLVRRPDGSYRAWRYGLEGPPEPLPLSTRFQRPGIGPTLRGDHPGRSEEDPWPARGRGEAAASRGP